jgi:hypothetical protein
MRTDLGISTGYEVQARRPSLLRRAAAAMVLVAVAALAIHLVIGLVMAVFWFAVVVAAAFAVLWAVKTLF